MSECSKEVMCRKKVIYLKGQMTFFLGKSLADPKISQMDLLLIVISSCLLGLQ
jgi:hypothetical protein